MSCPIPPQLYGTLELSADLIAAAVETARKAGASTPPSPRSARGCALKPGAKTPLWNELATAARAQLTRRGDKARLARLLGVSRQRVHELLQSRRALPDAERTLLLLVWLHARQQGHDLG